MQTFVQRVFAPLLHLNAKLRSPQGRPTPAELAAVRLAARGLSYKEIASALDKSPRTIEAQLRNAKRRTGAANIVDLVRRCQPWL